MALKPPILAFDTAVSGCSVTVLSGNGVIAFKKDDRPSSQAKYLVPYIEQTLNDAGVNYEHIGAIAVTVGPGSFTGVRIGLATAKAIALATHSPLVGVTTLEALAWAARGKGKPVLAALNAGRGQAYTQRFDERGAPIGEACVEDYAAIAAEECLVVGNAQALVHGERAEYLPDITLPDARHVAALALTRTLAAESVTPFYIRPPDAKPATA